MDRVKTWIMAMAIGAGIALAVTAAGCGVASDAEEGEPGIGYDLDEPADTPDPTYGPDADIEDLLFVGTGDECQSNPNTAVPDIYGGWNHHDHFNFAWGCGNVSNSGGSGVMAQHGTCNTAVCIGPPTSAGHTGTTMPGSVAYCVNAAGNPGGFAACWDTSDPCNPVRRLPAMTAAQCALPAYASSPFCSECWANSIFPAGLVQKTWGHGKGPDNICLTADDVYEPYLNTIAVPPSCLSE